MTASPERIAANQANAQLSCGPRTEAGKAASSRNALKHGFTGAGLALPDEDQAAVGQAFDRLFDEMKPRTQLGQDAVFKIAIGRLRLSRFATAERGILAQRVIDAGYAFDDAQVVRRDEAKAKLYQDPLTQLKMLARFEDGARWVVDAWHSLGGALEATYFESWRQPQFALFEALMGHSAEFPSRDRTSKWNLAAMGDESGLASPDLRGDTPAARCRCARQRLLETYREEVAQWEEHLEQAIAATAVARDNAIAAAHYDGTREGLLAKKYEAATNREIAKALKEFHEAEAKFADPEPIAETTDDAEPCVEVGSFLHEPERVSTEPTSIPGQLPRTTQLPPADVQELAPMTVTGVETDETCRL